MLGWPGKAREPFRDLLVHPALVWYLNQLVGEGFILDRAPEIWCEETCDTSAPLVGGNEPRDPRHCVLLPERAALQRGGAGAVGAGGCGGRGRRLCAGAVQPQGQCGDARGGGDRGRRYGAYLAAGAQGGGFADRGAGDGAGDAAVAGERTPAAVEYEFVGRGVIRSAGDGAEDRNRAAPGMARRLE